MVFDAGVAWQSGLLDREAFMMLLRTFASGSFNMVVLAVFFEAEIFGNVSEALAAKVETVFLDMCACSSASSAATEEVAAGAFFWRVVLDVFG